ncbi:hypothetical protein EC968_000818 [Mortierella alpina]|nr:hypothetical protein EC968_000818 [Mortierella alpina]
MRALSAPLLVQAIANKSVCLYLYQEYVRRVGIKFVFDHFDLARDRVVFRPEVGDHQYRFRSGLTLQNPQLEEIAVTTSGRAIRAHQVQQSGGRYYTVRRSTRADKQELARAQPIPIPSPAPSTSLAPESESPAIPDMAVSATMTGLSQPPISAARKRTTDEKVYHGAKNFLDKTCPVYVRRSGVRQLDGTRHSFLQDYPWTMHYQVDSEQLPFSNDGNRDRSSVTSSNQTPFFFNVRQHIYNNPVQAVVYNAGATEAGNQTAMSSSQAEANISPSEHSAESAKSGGYNSTTVQAVSGKQSGTPGSGPRYLRFLMFECSMKFLDPKRATRNIIGRWLEGKVQRWKKVLGGMRHITANIPQQHNAMKNTMQDDDGVDCHGIKGIPPRHSSSEHIGSLGLVNHNLAPEVLMNTPSSSSLGHPIQQATELRSSTVMAF